MKIKKKIVKKAVKKKVTAKKVTKKVLAKPANKPIGVVTHYFAKIKVAIVKFKQPVKIGSKFGFRGATTNFDQIISSMQFDHKPVLVAKKGAEIGIKVNKRVREGDELLPIVDKE